MPEKTALILLHEGVEEMEIVAPIDILRRGGIQVTVAAVGGSLHVRGRSGIVLAADALLADALSAAKERGGYDLIVIPGGPGVAALRSDAAVRQALLEHRDRGRLLGAICAAPLVLLDAGILDARGSQPYTAHPSTVAELPLADTTAAVVTATSSDTATAAAASSSSSSSSSDRPALITSRGAGTATAFALSLLEHLIGGAEGREAARSVAAAICLQAPQ